jgi:hypothetical protein
VSESKILRYEWLKLGRGSKYGFFELDLFGNWVREFRWFTFEYIDLFLFFATVVLILGYDLALGSCGSLKFRLMSEKFYGISAVFGGFWG